MSKFFKSVYYDGYHNKLYLKENVDGRDKRETITPKFEYYVKDPTRLSEIKDIYGVPVIKKSSTERSGLKSLQDSGVKLWESDLSIDMKFLQDRYLNEDLNVDINAFNIAFIDIEVAADSFPKASEAKYPINLITIYLSKTKQTYTFGLQEYTGNSEEIKDYRYFTDEDEMLNAFITFFRTQSIDILSGWNINFFDIPYICNRAEKLGIEKTLSPINICQKNEKAGTYNIAGLTVLDYLSVYKNFTYEEQESYSLNAIGLFELKKGKLEFEGMLNDLWQNDWNKFVEYNVQDVILVKEIDDKKKFIELMINLAFSALIPIDKVFSSISIHTGYILKFLHKKGLVMPDRKFGHASESLPGAFVDANPGFYKYVMSFDVESLYPHLILFYNISPETLRLNPDNTEGLIKTPVDGIYYDKSKKGILPEIIEMILKERKALKNKKKIYELIQEGKSKSEISQIIGLKSEVLNELLSEMKEENLDGKYYDSQQHVRKILANSLYGVLANEYFHFYNINNAKVITLGGQDLIKYLSSSANDYFKDHFYRNKQFFKEIDEKNKIKKDVVCLVDTDSCFLTLQEVIEKLGLKFQDNTEFLNWALEFDKTFLKPFFDRLLNMYAEEYDRPQIINFKREKIASKIIVLAKKKYAVEILNNEGITYDKPKLKFTGIEVVRTSTPKWCRDKIKDTVQYIFDTEDNNKVIDKLKELKKDFKLQRIEDIAFPRGVSDYQKYEISTTGIEVPKGCPIHVRASINYNYLIKKYKINNLPINDGTKIKFFYLKENNELHTNIMAFVGTWPKILDEKFEMDYDIQWEKSFQSVIQRFYDVIDWGEINLVNNKLNKFFI